MTTAQESPNGHRALPPPCLIHDSEDKDHSNKSTNTSPEPLPDRCQFTFSDTRQCTMARSDIHPSLCVYHSEREEQLFGVPAPSGHVVGAALDLPELYSACRDLTTPAGVHRALAQVFRLLAQRRISRQEAATFAKLGQLLLQSISAPRSSSESPAANVYLPPQKGYQPRRNVYQQDELSPLNKVELFADNNAELRGVNLRRERHGDQELSRVNKANQELSPVSRVPAASDDATRDDTSTAVIPSEQRERGIPPEPTPSSGIESNSRKMNTSERLVTNLPEINTYENTHLKPVRNQHLQKNGGRGAAKARRDETTIRSRVGGTSLPR